jgi:hypothetical protein
VGHRLASVAADCPILVHRLAFVVVYCPILAATRVANWAKKVVALARLLIAAGPMGLNMVFPIVDPIGIPTAVDSVGYPECKFHLAANSKGTFMGALKVNSIENFAAHLVANSVGILEANSKGIIEAKIMGNDNCHLLEGHDPQI